MASAVVGAAGGRAGVRSGRHEHDQDRDGGANYSLHTPAPSDCAPDLAMKVWVNQSSVDRRDGDFFAPGDRGIDPREAAAGRNAELIRAAGRWATRT
jgi:hypothetical protein